MRIVQFANGHFYHIYNRGVDKRIIFQKKTDFWRFYLSLYVFNDVKFKSPAGKSIFSLIDRCGLSHFLDATKREPMVRIISFCLLPNHFHILLEQLKDGGVSTFLYRIGKGYTQYFNKRYDRNGCLFQGVFQAVLVKHDAQFQHLPRYIHLNALDQTSFAWREGRVHDWVSAQEYLDQYQWSSHGVYMGFHQPLPVVDEKFAQELFLDVRCYKRFLRAWSGLRPYGRILDTTGGEGDFEILH